PHQATSTPISLIASNRYYIYAVWKEAGGEDFCDVAWRKVGDAAVAKYLPYIPGTVLETLADPRTLTLPALTISSPAEGSSFPIGATVTLTASALAAVGKTITKVEFFDLDKKVGEATTNPFSISV